MESTVKSGFTVLLAVIIFAVNSFINSLQTHLYPVEVARRSLPPVYTGVVLATHEITLIVISPVWAWLLCYLKERSSVLTACVLSGSASIAFSLLHIIPNASIFLALSIIFKIIQAAGHSLLCISLLALLLSELDKFKALAVSACLTFFSLAVIIGSNVATNLIVNELFTLPLSLLGILLIVLGLVSLTVIPPAVRDSDYTEQLQKSAFNFVSILRLPCVWIGIFTMLICTMNPFYLDTVMKPTLESLGVISVETVSMSLGVCFALSSMAWGFAIDKGLNPKACIAVSSLTICVSLTIVQSYFSLFPVWLVICGFIFSGVAWSGLTIAGLMQMITEAKAASLPMILKLYAIVVSVWQSSFSVRCGLIYEAFGFHYGNLIVASCTLVLFLICASSLINAAICSCNCTAHIRKLSLRKISQVDIVEQCQEQ